MPKRLNVDVSGTFYACNIQHSIHFLKICNQYCSHFEMFKKKILRHIILVLKYELSIVVMINHVIVLNEHDEY